MSNEIKNDVPNKPENLAWYIKYKQQIYGIVIFIFGALGGNVDRVTEFLPKSLDATEVNTRLDKLELTNISLVDKTTLNSGRISNLTNRVDQLEQNSGSSVGFYKNR